MSTPRGAYLSSGPALEELLAHLRACEWFALDTEFERERTYYPRLCLVQVASPQRVACIDPLAVSLQALGEVLFDDQIVKVLHAGTQDCEVLYQSLGGVPAPLFDTQLAAPLLGYPDQIGYAALVEDQLGVTLPKTATRTNWCARPLSDAQLRYAEDDVRYLAECYPRLRAALAERGRLSWLAEEFATLADAEQYRNLPEQAWRRIRGIERLEPGAGAAARALAEWRERQAQRIDRPRGWLLRDDTLLEIARLGPRDAAALAAVPGVHPRFAARHAPALLALLRELPRDAAAAPRAARPPPLNASETRLLSALEAQVVAVAAAEQLDATLLAGRRRLTRLVRGEPIAEVLAGWRKRLLAVPLQSVLDAAQRPGPAAPDAN